jgi:hypothetical protein
MINQCNNSIHNWAGQRARFCGWKADPSANYVDGRKCEIAIDYLVEMAIRSRKGRSPVENTPKRNRNVESGTFCIVVITISKLTKSDNNRIYQQSSVDIQWPLPIWKCSIISLYMSIPSWHRNVMEKRTSDGNSPIRMTFRCSQCLRASLRLQYWLL